MRMRKNVNDQKKADLAKTAHATTATTVGVHLKTGFNNGRAAN